MKIKNIMTSPLLVPGEMTVKEAVFQMRRSQSGCLVVVGGGGRPVGIFGPEDLLKYAEGYCGPDEKVENLAEGFHPVSPEEILSDVNSGEARYLLALNEQVPVGVVALSPPVVRLESYINRLKAMLDAAYNGIIEVDRDGRIVTLNQAMEKIIGAGAAELVGRAVADVIPNTGMTEVLKEGQPQIGKQIAIGDKTYISNRSPIYQNGNLIGAMAVLHDITELQQVVDELASERNDKELLETILDSTYEGIVIVDDQARITKISQAYAEFLGVGREEVIGKDVREVIENTRMHVVLETGDPELDQVQRIKGNDMICARIPIKRDGKVVCAVGKVMFKDVSQLKTLAVKVAQLQHELEYYKGELKKHQGTKYCIDSIVGKCHKMERLKSVALKVAKSSSTVLLLGESGTGKELFAHAIHNASPRCLGPFIRVNCAALPESLLESELFGYQEGAFTGAKKGGKTGKFELADGGTIFLDEIGDMPANMQAKILRVLQEREIERVGGSSPVKVDVRVIAATNRNLEEMVRINQFRDDLFYRLNVVTMEIPPLRERMEDIPVLVEFFLGKLCRQLGIGPRRISGDALAVLLHHRWPGNIRELENVLERALNIMEGETITPSFLPYYLTRRRTDGEEENIGPLKESLEAYEKAILERALEMTGGNRLTAAKMLKLSKSTLYEKISRYNLN
ncbi:MAG: sigma 54-interacting transcriptional regulator [Bacillota bacterium]